MKHNFPHTTGYSDLDNPQIVHLTDNAYHWSSMNVGGKENIGGKGESLTLLAGIRNYSGVHSSLAWTVPQAFCIPTQFSLNGWTQSRKVETLGEFVDQMLIPEHSPIRLTPFNSTDVLSVRSGAPVSMPGMMDTLLNVGIDNNTFPDVVERYGEAFAYKIRALGVREYSKFEGRSMELFDLVDKQILNWFGPTTDKAQMAQAERLRYTNYVKHGRNGIPMPMRKEQLIQAAMWVWNSYQSERCQAYRKNNDLPNDMGTAVIFQRMVFGNMNHNSGSGVYFNKDPRTGRPNDITDFLSNAQGEAVVSGTAIGVQQWPSFQKRFDGHAEALRDLGSLLNSQRQWGIVDIEYTIENDELFILQCREGKASKTAKIRAVTHDIRDSVYSPEHGAEKIIEIAAIEDEVLAAGKVLAAGTEPVEVLAKASQGTMIVAGQVTAAVATTHTEAAEFVEQGTPYVYVAEATSPNDYLPMSTAAGLLTARGGLLSHAAIIARELNIPTIVGCKGLSVVGPFRTIDDNSLNKVTLHGKDVFYE